MEPDRESVRRRNMKRWLVPLAAAAAVLALLGGLWWIAGPGSRGEDTSFAGGDTGSGPDTSGVVPGSPGAGVPGAPGGDEPGSSEPGFPGTGLPGEPPSFEPVPKQTNPMGVVINSYYQYDADSLAINYTIGVPECYGTIGEPAVEETSQSVTVTLTRIPPKQNDNVACIDIALLKTVDIELSSPLGDRLVRDGSFDAAVVQPGSLPGQDTPAH